MVKRSIQNGSARELENVARGEKEFLVLRETSEAEKLWIRCVHQFSQELGSHSNLK